MRKITILIFLPIDRNVDLEKSAYDARTGAEAYPPRPSPPPTKKYVHGGG